MNVLFGKASIAASATLSLLVLASGAPAAPSLGFPSGRPYYGSSNQQSGSRSGYMPSYAPAGSAETRQSYSYEPGESAEPATEAKSGCGCGAQSAAPQASNEDNNNDVAAAPDMTRRSYSYEPATQPGSSARSFSRSAASKKDPWLYPKGDPRRYNY
jgi:hypothetical protein